MRPGQRLGQYELICQTAQGGMASIWLARSSGSRGFTKVVAIKTMLPSVVADPGAERMFLAEASVASRIDHPNVVQTHDLCEDGGALYLVMEWVRGEALSTVYSAAAARGGIPLGLAVRIVSQILAGLHAAHELADASGRCLGLVHRDVSPHNVLVGFNGVVKLVDFGIAKLTGVADGPGETGELKGKVAYMAPEQIRLEAVDRRTDIFAAGILLYLLTTGIHPFKRGDHRETALAILSDDPVAPPSSVREGFSKRLESVVLKALAKHPEDRYATAKEFGEELVRALPPSHQGSGHDELRAYMKELLPAHFEKQQDLVRIAREAPERTFASAPVTIGQVFKQSGRSSATLRAVAVATDNEGTLHSAAPPLEGEPSAARPGLVRRLPGKAVLGFALVALMVSLGLATFVRTGRHAAAVASEGPPGENRAPTQVREPAPQEVAPEAPQGPRAEVASPPASVEQSQPAPARSSSPGASLQKSRKPVQGAKPRKIETGLKDPY